jgi:hypothetical protein
VDTPRDRNVAVLAVVAGLVTLLSVASLGLFYTLGKPFGAINDWTVGLSGFVSGMLAWAIRARAIVRAPGSATVSTWVAVIGAAVVVAGSALVISQTTGFVLAGLVESLGFALIGLWLIALNRSMGSTSRWPRHLPTLGLVAGIVMALGFVAAPGILMGLDDADTAPAWIWIAFIGWVGIFFLYPIWCIRFGRVLGGDREPFGR